MTKLFKPFSTNLIALSSLTLLVLPLILSSSTQLTCQTQDQHTEQSNKEEALQYKLIAIASILLAGSLGVSLPFLVRNLPSLNPDKDIYFLIKAFAAGVILATGFIHVLPDAYEGLTSPCLAEHPWRKFPFAGFVAMFAAIATLMMEALATGYHKRSELRKSQPLDCDEESDRDDHHGIDGTAGVDHHVHGSSFALEVSNNSADLIRHRIISQVLELGIVVHSVIIGISLGASQSSKTIKLLVTALSFHQFFEGLGLGGCIYQAKFKCKTVAIMVLFFSLTTPIGITVGIGISNTYKYNYIENNPAALIIQGLLLSASAGILIYMALVDLLAADFMNPKLVCNLRLQLGANFTLLLGACSMSLLAKWAE